MTAAPNWRPPSQGPAKKPCWKNPWAYPTSPTFSLCGKKQTLGLGHAVLMAKPFTGSEPFVVMYGDDVILGEAPWPPAHPLRLRGVRPPGGGHEGSTPEAIVKYSSMKTAPIQGNHYLIDDMIEKPAPARSSACSAFWAAACSRPKSTPSWSTPPPARRRDTTHRRHGRNGPRGQHHRGGLYGQALRYGQ